MTTLPVTLPEPLRGVAMFTGNRSATYRIVGFGDYSTGSDDFGIPVVHGRGCGADLRLHRRFLFAPGSAARRRSLLREGVGILSGGPRLEGAHRLDRGVALVDQAALGVDDLPVHRSAEQRL